MRTHQEVDNRSLALARAVASVIDADPERAGLERAKRTCARWLENPDLDNPYLRRWSAILENDWPAVKAVLLDPSEDGTAMRQCSPFAGVLPPRERWRVYREHRDTGKAGTP